MKETPRISIVTPSLNQGRFIESSILSILNQGYHNFEHIIIDGGSQDETLGVLERYSHLIWVSEPDQGQSDALNKGFRMSTSDIIGWLNADDLYLPGCFHTVSKFFREHPDVDIVYGDCRWVDEYGRVIQIRRELDFDLFMLKYLHILYIPTTSTFFRRRIIEEKNFLNIEYHYSMDYEWFLRLAIKGYKFCHIRTLLTDFRRHPSSKSVASPMSQLFELERALMQHDELLRNVRHNVLRSLLRRALMMIARMKRYFFKAIHGCYFSQWPLLKTDL